ncbi:MAG: polysaccharide biosynthesis protein [Lentisphaerae bacterium]|nr:polysaccharide biosynthesis protein [Lentisphaerota bacterium]
MAARFGNPKLYLMLAADALLMALSMLLAYAIRFDFAIPAYYRRQIAPLLCLVLPVKALCLSAFGLYRGMWRYTGLKDIVRLFQALTVASLAVVLTLAWFQGTSGLSRGVFVLDGLISFLLTGALRTGIRGVFLHRSGLQAMALPRVLNWRGQFRSGVRTMIVGAGIAGERILQEIQENPKLACSVVGFVDDDPGKRGRSVHGIPVIGTVDALGRCIDRHGVRKVLVTISGVSAATMRRIVQDCEGRRVELKIVPGIGELIGGKAGLKDLRDVDYEDLLGREPAQLDVESIRGYIEGKSVLVTGCGGSIGSELCRQIIEFRPGLLVLLDSSEANLFAMELQLKTRLRFPRHVAILGSVADECLMERVFERYKPSVVFHAAAYKHVPMLEANPWEAVTNNILGSCATMRAATKHGAARFVLVSTDKAVRPTNVMGASKRVAELAMHAMAGNGTVFMAVRFGNVVGSSGSVVPIFREQIRSGGPVTVTHPEVTRYFMSIPEAARLILQAGGLGTGGETFVLDMGQPVRIAAMARDLLRLSGMDPDREGSIVFTGLRPGEKLHEELITEGEGVAPTSHKGILVLKREAGSQPDSGLLMGAIEELAEIAGRHDAAGIRRKLVEILPEYAVQQNVPVL